MDWFGRQRREEERQALARALAEMSARHHATELFVLAILDALDTTDREAVLASVRKCMASTGEAMPPSFVPAGSETAYRNELSRVLQILMEMTMD
jgi:hypothetical protein